MFLDSLDRHILASELVHAKGYFAESALAYQFDELVKLKGRRWQLIILRDVILDIGDELVSLVKDTVLNFERRTCRDDI